MNLGDDAGPCTRPRCKGTLTVEAHGVGGDGLPSTFAICGTCGWVVTFAAPPLEGQEALPW